MEGRDMVSGVTVVGSDGPSGYHAAPRNDNPAPAGGSAVAMPGTQVGVPLQQQQAAVAAVAEKKKRGRPRKYAADGSVTMAMSPKPISSSGLPAMIDFSSGKRGKVRPPGSVSKAKFEASGLDARQSVLILPPHFITANSGEIISFSQQGPRAICILSANVVISSVTLRQPDSSGGTLTYEGRFEILSLSGSFMPNDNGGTRSRSGGMSISLASPDGRVVGGGVAGLLVAASPVQVVVGSFLAGKQQQSNHKKQKFEVISTATPPAAAAAHANLSTCSSWSNPTDISVSFPGG
ncbi:AT-hook motif nuclear-localized protein 1 [Arachis duranensis]|uniref:AT-hook motif nuclear-localized protein n=1 Tax=Arachis duranensis TaxID=130453 RepID=A0A9C6TZN0_ARADU|nr:AT-hook motif nuclear-localized protein 1 [Arachis duranensis]